MRLRAPSGLGPGMAVRIMLTSDRERLEQAMHPSTTPEQRRHLLSIGIVGGGPTGVEFAAELHDFVVQDIYRLYPELKDVVSIKVYDVQQHILSTFDESVFAFGGPGGGSSDRRG